MEPAKENNQGWLFTYFGELIMSAIVATQVNGVMVVDSRLIAEDIGIAHNALMQNIRNHKTRIEQDFGRLQFEIDTLETRGGLQKQPFVLLTEDQSYFILTLSRNTERVMDAKAALVKAFSRLRQEQVKPQLTLPQTYLEALEALVASEKEKQALQLKVAEDAPKVELAEAFIERDGLVMLGDFAKDYGKIGRNRLFKLLRDKGVLLSNNHPKQTYVDRGLFVLRPCDTLVFGREQFTTHLTPEGVQWLCTRLEKWLAGE